MISKILGCICCDNINKVNSKYCGTCQLYIRRAALKLLCLFYKKEVCEKCSFQGEPYLYDFHHLSNKQAEISKMIADQIPWDKLKAELDKCLLLCCYCHRKEHWYTDSAIRNAALKTYTENRFNLPIIENQNRLCRFCKKLADIGSSTCNTCYASIQRYKLKLWAVKAMGETCAKCGINEQICIFDFHHPNEKYEYRVSQLIGSRRSKTTILSELNKCIMLCVACHRKQHTVIKKEIYEQEINKRYNLIMTELDENFNKKPNLPRFCARCDYLLKPEQKNFCSTICWQITNRKVERPTKQQLEIDLQTMPYTETGTKYNVSDKTIKKWALAYNIPVKTRLYRKISAPFISEKN